MTALRPPSADVPVALCLGGLDPSGGAGILRDVAAVAGLGVHPMAISLADTVQNGLGCQAILAPQAPLRQLEALAPHLAGAWGVKLGLCALPESAFGDLARRLASLAPAVRIWDPVQAPTAGVGLHDAATLRAMAGTLLPGGGWVVSPNRLEAQALAGRTGDPADLAAPLLALGAEAVWLKGGHAEGDRVQDLWVDAAGVRPLEAAPRLPGDRRGTGCALASRWLAWRLRGLDGPEAALQAARDLRAAWEPGIAPGGQGRPCLSPFPAREAV